LWRNLLLIICITGVLFYAPFWLLRRHLIRVHYCKLFKLLVSRHVPDCIVSVLINFYTSNYVRVSWCGILSDYFLSVNGVKQGGVLSPVLFGLYVDGLLVKLSKAGIGRFVGRNFIGALAYADDIVLLAPTASALRKMLAIYAIVRWKPDWICWFVLASIGHLLTNKWTVSSDVLKRRGDFVGQVNNMLCYFCKLTSLLRNRLFQCYCTSLYGCELWLLTTNKIEDM